MGRRGVRDVSVEEEKGKECAGSWHFVHFTSSAVARSEKKSPPSPILMILSERIHKIMILGDN
jgi:hypothetical protein